MTTTTPSDELLPCPFCGGEVQHRHALWPSEGDEDAIIHANPTECGLNGGFTIGTADNGLSVAVAWNRRAQSSYSASLNSSVAVQQEPPTADHTEESLEMVSAEPGDAEMLQWLLTPQQGREDRPAKIERVINRNAHRALIEFRAWCGPDEARAALESSLRLALAAREWQPIETAPKDGTRILLGRTPDLDEDGEPRPGEVAEGYWQEGYEDGPDIMGHDDCWTDSRFEIFSYPRSFGAEKFRTAGYQPTHWMLLPAAPKGTP